MVPFVGHGLTCILNKIDKTQLQSVFPVMTGGNGESNFSWTFIFGRRYLFGKKSLLGSKSIVSFPLCVNEKRSHDFTGVILCQYGPMAGRHKFSG